MTDDHEKEVDQIEDSINGELAIYELRDNDGYLKSDVYVEVVR